jgi:DNA-binding LacI/PurR family transcriptional regulator
VAAAGKPKFLILRDQLRDRILAGEFRDGDTLPPEAELGRAHGLSRVTVRKALDELKRERIARGIRGSGTVVTLGREGFRGHLDMVVLVAPLFEAFFSQFFQHFEAAADRHGAVVVFKQDSRSTLMADPTFYRRFLDKGIRDFVLWPRRGFAGAELLPRLRGLGVNLVFFDHFVDTTAADCVGLDNTHAIATLVADLRRRGCRTIDFIGWDDVPLSSTREREAAFATAAATAPQSGGRVFRLSRFKQKAPPLDAQIRALLARLSTDRAVPDGLVAINGDLGAAAATALVAAGLRNVRLATVDPVPATPGLETSSMIQPMKQMAERAFACLLGQNRLGAAWTARRHALPGTLVRGGRDVSPAR